MVVFHLSHAHLSGDENGDSQNVACKTRSRSEGANAVQLLTSNGDQRERTVKFWRYASQQLTSEATLSSTQHLTLRLSRQ